jgi:hypothetical protein
MDENGIYLVSHATSENEKTEEKEERGEGGGERNIGPSTYGCHPMQHSSCSKGLQRRKRPRANVITCTRENRNDMHMTHSKLARTRATSQPPLTQNTDKDERTAIDFLDWRGACRAAAARVGGRAYRIHAIGQDGT